jgi:hypothetical protein
MHCVCAWLQGRGGEDWGIELARALEASLVGSPAGGERQQQHRWPGSSSSSCCRGVAAAVRAVTGTGAMAAT